MFYLGFFKVTLFGELIEQFNSMRKIKYNFILILVSKIKRQTVLKTKFENERT